MATTEEAAPNRVQSDDSSSDGKAKTPLAGRFRRPRSLRACEICHTRKVRCDATLRMPCTNCVTFGCECKIHELKRRRTPKVKVEEDGSEGETQQAKRPKKSTRQPPSETDIKLKLSARELSIGQKSGKFGSASKSFFGSTAYINIILGQSRAPGTTLEAMPEVSRELEESLSKLDETELAVLKLRGSFLLPDEDLCWEMIDKYFVHINPLLPLLNRSKFMREYRDLENPPSLLLLQTVLLCGSRAMEPERFGGSTLHTIDKVSSILYQRAKALYDANIETKPLPIVQSLLMFGWYWDGVEDVTKNVFYWTRVAISVAQGFGFQRDLPRSQSTSEVEKRIWRRVWWALFMKDRGVAVAFGRPVMIDLEDCDVPMVTEEDFNEDEPGYPSPHPRDQTAIDFFIHSVKLAELIGLILSQQYSVRAEETTKGLGRLPVVRNCDMLMGNWLENLPASLQYMINDPSRQSIYSAMINAQYYAILCLVHRTNIIRRTKIVMRDCTSVKNDHMSTPAAKTLNDESDDEYYPSWGITFQASHMIAIISKNLLDSGQIGLCAPAMVYSIFTAGVILLYHHHNKNPKIVRIAKSATDMCLRAFEEISKHWGIAKITLRVLQVLLADEQKQQMIIKDLLKRVESRALVDNDYDALVSTADVSEGLKINKKPISHPDYTLVTQNISNSATPYFANFNPSQLFPEMNINSAHNSPRKHSGSDDDLPMFMDGISTNWTPSFDVSGPGIFDGTKPTYKPTAELIPSVTESVAKSDSTSPDVLPNTMNVKEWYDYLF